MKNKIILFVLLNISFLGFGQIPSGYYDDATGTEAALKTQLYNIIKGHTDVGYDGLYSVYINSDNIIVSGNNRVYDMYSIKANGTADYYYSHVSGDRCGNYTGESDCYNREHTFCDSWLGAASPQRSDAHHIVPTDGYVNNRRSSYPHGKVGSVTWTSSNGSKLGSSDPSTGYTGTVFEPIDEYKGDFARMYFYVATRYENLIDGWVSNGSASEILNGTEYPAYKPWFINLLISWHTQDPVSTKEIVRNNAIYTFQHNRNPFIDHPEYVTQIWGGGSNAFPTITNVLKSPSSPSSIDAVSVSATIADSDGSISGVTLNWGLTSGTHNNTITMSVSSGTTYVSNSNIPAQSGGTVVYYKISATDNEDANTLSSQFSYLVNTLGNENPVISSLVFSPEIPTSSESVSVSANITDTEGTISSAKIKWGTSIGVYGNTISMSASGDSYSGTIPAQANATHIYFIVEAYDNSGGSALSTEKNYIVTNPVNQAPEISDVQFSPTNPTDLDSVLVSATAIDPDGTLNSVFLKWKLGTETTIYEREMDYLESEYKAYIPAQMAGKSIYFMIVATDNNYAETKYMDGTYNISTSSSTGSSFELNQIEIYPNPVKDNLILFFPDENQNVTVVIYNMIGVVVRQESFNEVKGEVRINQLNNLGGIYLLQVKTKNEQLIKKIVINNNSN